MGPQPTGFMGQQPQQQQQQQHQQMQPMQTGYGGQQQQQRPMGGNVPPMPTGQQTGGGGNYSFLNTQPTGFRPSFTGASGSGLNPQMTGFPGGGASGLLSQPTGYGGGGMMSQPTGMGMGGGMMSQPTGMSGGLMSQPTGMGLRAQPTGVHDPRLQTMMQSFMPSNMSQVSCRCIWSSGTSTDVLAIHLVRCSPVSADPTTAPAAIPIPPTEPIGQDAQSTLGAHQAGKEGLRPDLQGVGYGWRWVHYWRNGQGGLWPVWLASGRAHEDLASQEKILRLIVVLTSRTLSDVDNRGKLNLPEFHVAMGLIYRGKLRTA
jgi:hypothetical protein